MTVHLGPIFGFLMATVIYAMMCVFLFLMIIGMEPNCGTKAEKNVFFSLALFVGVVWYGWIYGLIHFSWN